MIGHRGAARHAPENTLAGFRRAATLGCPWVEFDVRLTGDDRPVVFHDDRLERTTDGAGFVRATALKDLAQLDAGRGFDPAYRGERIPTLDQVLALLATLGLGCDLEMKADTGREELLAATVADALRPIGAELASSILVTSFSEPAIEAFARRAPDIPRGYLADKLPADWLARTESIDAVAVACNHETLRAEEAHAVKAAGLSLLAYTVNEPGRAQELFDAGVDSVISDAPDAILAILPRRH